MLNLFLILIFIQQCWATLDLCDGDPEIRVKLNKTCGPSHLIAIPQVHGNPYHALHDVGWAVSHYLSNCIHSQNISYVWVKTDREKKFNLCNSGTENQADEQRPSWGACLIMGTALNVGLPSNNIYFTENKPNRCFRKTTEIPARFRPLKYCIREKGQKWWSKRSKMPLLPMPMRRSALFGLVNGVLNVYKFRETHIHNELLNVLVYDRRNARRRRWANVNETLRRLKLDERLNVTYLSALPRSFGGQIEIFRASDIVVTPHGAALANSLFMNSGSEIIEIHKCCRDEVRLSPTAYRGWTGWHAPLMSLGIQYIQCHKEDKYLSVADLNKTEHKTAEDRWCKLKKFNVEPEDVLQALNKAVRKIKTKQSKNQYISILHSEAQIQGVIFLLFSFTTFVIYKRGKNSKSNRMQMNMGT